MSIYRSLDTAKVGDRLHYGWHGYEDYLPTAIITVTEVGKNWIKTDDGKKWKMAGGQEWGEKYSIIHIGFVGPEDDKVWKEIRERRAALTLLIPLIEGRWELDLTVVQIKGIVAILKPAGSEA
jgi:hypothetical protein